MNCVWISALGCMSCIVMHDNIEAILNKYQIDYQALDADFDDLSTFDFKNDYPVLLFYENETKIKEFNGEFALSALEDFLKVARQ